MTTRAKSILKIKNNILNYVFKRRLGKQPIEQPHMDELPIPSAPWEPWYKAKQRYYNTVLFIGTSWFLFSLGMMIYTDSLLLNFSPPDEPGPPSGMTDECLDAT